MMDMRGYTKSNNRVIDYIGDDLYGSKPSYGSQELAQSFSLVTGKDYTKADIERQFGKSSITDSDLYSMVDLNGKADGYLSSSEINKFMSSAPAGNLESGSGDSFSYLEDGKSEYTLKEVADKIAGSTGKRISEADLKKIMGGKDTINDFEMMLLLDNQSRDGKVSSGEMNKLISDFKINYTIDNGDGGTDVPADTKKSLYRGDGKWDYTKDEFKKKMKDDLGIDLSDDAIKKLFGDGPINDRTIERALDLNKDGNIGNGETNYVLNGSNGSTGNNFNYLDDNKTSYTRNEAATELNKLRTTPLTQAELTKLFGDKTTISDSDLLGIIDKFSPNGSISSVDLNSALAQPTITNPEFNYLGDNKQSYTASELAQLLTSDTGVTITANDVSKFFGKDKISDSDILKMDTNSLNGRIDAEEAGLIQQQIMI